MAVARGFFVELKRRNVLRAAVLYAGAVWALAQGIAQLAPAFGAPDWIARWFVIAGVIGFPFWVAFAWYYEFTPHGFRRESEIAPDAPLHHSNARRMDFAIIGVLALAVVLLLTNTLVWRKGAGMQPASNAAAATGIPAKSIAVLPFENLNVDKKSAYFVAGMQDLVLTKLAEIGDLKVIARTSTLQYGSHPENLKTIGQQLGVATLLEGTVQKSGDQVLISVQLIDARSDAHIWAQSYQRTLDNVFGVEGEVAEKIAQALKAKLSPAESQRLATALSPDPAANDLYLRAEYFTKHGGINYDTASFRQAIPLYRQALAADPDFALARAGLSFAESALAWFGGTGENVQQLRADARTQAERALELQPDLAEAHLAIGFSDYWGRSDYSGALQAFAAALKARPNDAGALAARGYVLRRQGHFDVAIDAFQQALTHDPRNTERAFELGATNLMASHFVEAEAALQHALALDPDNVQARLTYSRAIVLASGNVTRALNEAQGDDPQLQLQRVFLLTFQRNYRAALALLASIPDTPDNFSYVNGSKPLLQANLYRWAGDATHARSLYAQALPLARAQLKAQAGIAGNENLVWCHVANAELGLGDTSAGLAALAQSQALMTQSGDHIYGPLTMAFCARAYAQAGRSDLAVPLLETALATPGISLSYSPALLWLDPAWNPIRHDPRFQALLKKYAKYKPASVATIARPVQASTAGRG